MKIEQRIIQDEPWYQEIGNKRYWEWRHLARRKLEQLAIYKEMNHRWCNDRDQQYQYPSDQFYVKAIKDCLSAYFLVLKEMDNPIEAFPL